MGPEEHFDFIFKSNPIEYKALSDDDLNSAYLQYLLENFNSSAKTKTHFDWGTIVSSTKTIFLWGTNPIIHLLGAPATPESVFKDLTKENDACTLLAGMEYCVRRHSKDQGILKEIKKLKGDACKDVTCDTGSYKGNIISIIQNDPTSLGHGGFIKTSLPLVENPEITLKKALYDKLIEKFKSREAGTGGEFVLLKSKMDPIPNFGVTKVDAIKNPDILFLIKYKDKYKLFSIELKFGRGENCADQSVKSHLILNKLFSRFKDLEVYSILFSPYLLIEKFEEEVIRKLFDTKNRFCDIPFLLLESFDNKHNLLTCFGEFTKEETSLVNQLRNQQTVEKLIRKHLELLKEDIKKLIEK